MVLENTQLLDDNVDEWLLEWMKVMDESHTAYFAFSTEGAVTVQNPCQYHLPHWQTISETTVLSHLSTLKNNGARRSWKDIR